MDGRTDRWAYVFVVVVLIEVFDWLSIELWRKFSESRWKRPSSFQGWIRLETIVLLLVLLLLLQTVLHFLGHKLSLAFIFDPTLDLRQRFLGEETEVGWSELLVTVHERHWLSSAEDLNHLQ